jgi:hypothetical protein
VIWQTSSLRRSRALLLRSSPREGEAARFARGDRQRLHDGNFFHDDRAKTLASAGGAPTAASDAGPMSTLPGRLNLFQATMLDWRDLHPYNAVHAVWIDRPFDASAVTTAIERQLSDGGLTGLVLDRRRARYAWRGGAAHVEIEIVDAGDDSAASLARAFERHLNAPFPREGAIEPFRFFAVPHQHAFFLGIAYDHFIAGGDSIVALLDAIAARHAGKSTQATPLRRYPRTHAHLFARHPVRFVRGLGRLPALARSCRRTIRPHYHAIEDGHNGFTFCWLSQAQYRALRSAAKAWDVTLNDALIALLLLAQDAAMPGRDMTRRRHELAVASVVNLRRAHGEDAHRTFGQFLSSFRVSHPVPAGTPPAALAKDVHRATMRIKSEQLFLTTLFAMAVDRLIGQWQSPQQRLGIYAKNYPVGAGISSLNVGALWQAGGDTDAPMYVRGVPTGPLSPIVVAATTSGERMCLGISYRTAAVTPDAAAALRDDLVARIDALTS